MYILRFYACCLFRFDARFSVGSVHVCSFAPSSFLTTLITLSYGVNNINNGEEEERLRPIHRLSWLQSQFQNGAPLEIHHVICVFWLLHRYFSLVFYHYFYSFKIVLYVFDEIPENNSLSVP